MKGELRHYSKCLGMMHLNQLPFSACACILLTSDGAEDLIVVVVRLIVDESSMKGELRLYSECSHMMRPIIYMAPSAHGHASCMML